MSAAVAVVGGPKVLLLDEPTAGVDLVARRSLWVILDALRMAGTSIVLTSHSLEECEVLCSRVGIVRSGRLAAIGSPTELRAGGQAKKQR